MRPVEEQMNNCFFHWISWGKKRSVAGVIPLPGILIKLIFVAQTIFSTIKIEHYD